MRCFPTPARGALASLEPEDPGYHILHQTTGKICNDVPFTKAEVDRLRNALLERADGPSPGPLPTRPRHGAAEVVAGGSSMVEGPATDTHPRSTASTQVTGDRVTTVIRDPSGEKLFPAEHPFI
jgi:hypothetical protein